MTVTVITFTHGVDGAMVEDEHEFETGAEALQFHDRYNEIYARERMSSPRKSAMILDYQPERNKPMPQPKLKVQLKKFYPDAIIPEYKTPGAAAFDLHAYLLDGEPILVYPGQTVIVPTGVGIYLQDPQYALFICDRSGLSTKGVKRSAGVVDADYQGQIGVVLTNNSTEMFLVRHGDRIAQAVIQSVWHADFQIVDEFSEETERGHGAWGSTGA